MTNFLSIEKGYFEGQCIKSISNFLLSNFLKCFTKCAQNFFLICYLSFQWSKNLEFFLQKEKEKKIQSPRFQEKCVQYFLPNKTVANRCSRIYGAESFTSITKLPFQLTIDEEKLLMKNSFQRHLSK